jgi:hypothetical protein
MALRLPRAAEREFIAAANIQAVYVAAAERPELCQHVARSVPFADRIAPSLERHQDHQRALGGGQNRSPADLAARSTPACHEARLACWWPTPRPPSAASRTLPPE